MAVETCRYPQPNEAQATAILKQVIRKLAGKEAFASYVQANKSGWQLMPPPRILTPTNNQRSLYGAVFDLKSRTGLTLGRSATQNGKTTIVWDAPPPEMQAEQTYLENWLKALQPA